MEIKIDRIVRQANQAYYMVYTGTVLSTLIGYYLTMSREAAPDPKSQLSISLSSVIIMYTIISIPLALWTFQKKLKTWRNIEDPFVKQKKYISGAQTRLALVGVSLLSSVIGHFYLYAGTSNFSLIFCAGIAAIGLYFCKPTAKKVAIDLEIEEDEE